MALSCVPLMHDIVLQDRQLFEEVSVYRLDLEELSGGNLMLELVELIVTCGREDGAFS
eukprot:CAMPEP_0170554018 /NCGR_PEP_ID=MMETSP0211-20121228/11886_1 /TAXON_ID=311385 /ORGANISM="Pseudokeronopsis sp., Strain OXSARD2" /LENGTH=57 /DNA_ID=CAMNT_0010862787 /DNA_START=85 /DNA_END=255 /DNA_ORIENTATION=+